MSEPSPERVTVVLTTAPDGRVAEALAEDLLADRLIACANLVDRVRSLYRWDGRVQRDDEVLLVLKTTSEAVPRVRDRIVELHPYDVPEVLCLPARGGLDAYLDWVAAEVGGDGDV